MLLHTYVVGGFLKIKIDAHLIQGTIFNVENDGDIDFSINRKTGVQEPIKDSFFFTSGFFT